VKEYVRSRSGADGRSALIERSIHCIEAALCQSPTLLPGVLAKKGAQVGIGHSLQKST